jgi:hypothetical protein
MVSSVMGKKQISKKFYGNIEAMRKAVLVVQERVIGKPC